MATSTAARTTSCTLLGDHDTMHAQATDHTLRDSYGDVMSTMDAKVTLRGNAAGSKC